MLMGSNGIAGCMWPAGQRFLTLLYSLTHDQCSTSLQNKEAQGNLVGLKLGAPPASSLTKSCGCYCFTINAMKFSSRSLSKTFTP